MVRGPAPFYGSGIFGPIPSGGERMLTAKTWNPTVIVLAVLTSVSAWAPPAGAEVTDVPDRFAIEVGGFNVDADTVLRLSSVRLDGTTVDFEQDLDLPDNANRGFFDAYWRISRRHLVNLSVSRLHREGPGHILEREITWRDEVFLAGSTVRGTVDSDYFSGAYRFAAVRNDTFEIGPAVGLGFVRVTAGLRGDVFVDGQATRAVDASADTTSPTADLGGYLRWWPGRRVLVRADGRYILVKPENAEASVTDGRLGITWYPWPKAGFGVQYLYAKFRYDRDILSSELSGHYRYRGAQLLVSFAF